MKQHQVIQIVGLLLVLASTVLATACQVEVQAASVSQEGTPVQDSVETANGPVEVNGQYEAYGFLFEQYHDHQTYGRFTAHEIYVLGEVIMAYAKLVGGPEALTVLVNGPVRVRRDLHEIVSYTQAGQVIGLGRGAFDLALSQESNYYTWGADSGDGLAQIVFGHEIAHRWVDALRKRDGVDWGVKYGQNVWRGERASTRGLWNELPQSGGTPASPEEEAVTNMALYVLGKSYRWTFLHDAPCTERRQVMVDGWVYDVVANSE
jgi:hypothetical protein